MTYSFDGFNYLIRLSKGEHLAEALTQFAEATHTHGVWFSGFGGALEVTLGFYSLDTKQYKWQTFTGLREITALQGNLALDEKGAVMQHVHGSFADASFQTVGGHVKDLIAGATVELFVHRIYGPIQRKTDKDTGLQLLDLSKTL